MKKNKRKIVVFDVDNKFAVKLSRRTKYKNVNKVLYKILYYLHGVFISAKKFQESFKISNVTNKQLVKRKKIKNI